MNASIQYSLMARNQQDAGRVSGQWFMMMKRAI
jgi:hypothetical protein